MLVIFDLDGTILDTLSDLLGAMNASLAHHGFPGHTLEEMRTYIGNGLRMMAVRAVPPCTEETAVESVYRYFKQYYAEHLDISTAPYPGVTEMLKTLRSRGIHVAVSTNKFDPGAKKLVNAHFGDLVEYTLGETEGTPRKPDPAGPRKIMEYFGASAADTVYVGDSTVDIETANNLGVRCATVTWGFQDREKLESVHAPVIISDMEALTAHLIALHSEG